MQATSIMAASSYPTFLYPKSRQFPVDEVCEKIVRALEKRNWKVPGVQVKFNDSGTGELKYRYVSIIKGADFRLWFCRIQGRISYWKNDVAAITEISIPKRELHVYDDESGPTYFTYVGDNWEEDKEKFMNASKYCNTVNGEKNKFLSYNGRCGPLDENGYSYRSNLVGRRNPYLVTDSVFGNEYSANDGLPKYFLTHQVFEEVNEWLTDNVLQKIESIEEASEVDLITEQSTPYPNDVGPFYVKVGWETYNRINKGKEDKNQLEPSKRYALLGGGNQLISSDVRNDGSIPKKAYRGFKYCSLERPELKEDDGYVALLRINPKSANCIYVVDEAPSIKYKRQWLEANPKKRMWTNEEFDEFQRLKGRTIVPVHQYEGNYEKPVVLIGSSRELSFDEVEIVDVKEIKESMMRNDDDKCVIC